MYIYIYDPQTKIPFEEMTVPVDCPFRNFRFWAGSEVGVKSCFWVAPTKGYEKSTTCLRCLRCFALPGRPRIARFALHFVTS